MSLMERLLPRHMQIVYQINPLHLDTVCALPRTDGPPLSVLSLIDEGSGRQVRMGELAFLGSHKVNGVSALHTELMRATVFHDLHALYPDRIVNKTNGITLSALAVRRPIPALTRLLVDASAKRVLDDRGALEGFRQVADDTAVHERFAAASAAPTSRCWRAGRRAVGIRLDPRRACSTCRSSVSTNTSASC